MEEGAEEIILGNRSCRIRCNAELRDNPKFFPEYAKKHAELIKEAKIIGTCFICVRSPTANTVQVHITCDGSKFMIPITHLTLLAYHKRPPTWFAHGSHLCGIRRCINPDHIIWELPWDNIHRDACHKYKYYKECPHSPKCLPEPDWQPVLAELKAAADRKRKPGN